MKYAVFGLLLVLGVPAMAGAAAWSGRLRGLLLAALVFSPVLGDLANINFVSMEAYRGPDRGFEINLTDLIAWALVLALLARDSGRIRWFPFNTGLMAIFFGLAVVTSVQAAMPLYGAFALFKFARAYVLYWCVVNCLRTGTSPRYIWAGLVSAGFTLGALVVYQKYGLHLYRAHALFDHSNTIPPFANLMLPVLLTWILVDRTFSRVGFLLGGAAVAGLAMATLATLSRAGMLLAAVGVLTAFMLAARGTTFRSGAFVRLSATMILALLVASVGTAKAWDSVVYRFQNAPESSQEARAELNEAARHMTSDNLLLGVGLNNFSLALTETERYRAHLTVTAGEEQGGVVHDIYRLTAAETGLAGLLIFILVIGRFAWMALRDTLRRVSLGGAVQGGLLSGVMLNHASGMLEWTFRITPVLYLFAILTGFSVALAREDGPE